MSYAQLPQPIRHTAETHLTPKQLKVFQLRQDGHSWATIGLATGKDEATCRGHYERALRRMRKTFTRFGGVGWR